MTIIFLIFAALAKSIMDVLQFHYKRTPFAKLGNQQWWNPKISHSNKYKNNSVLSGEKFPGSVTIFVWVTDAWHFFQMIFLTFMFLSIVFYNPIFNLTYGFLLDFIIYRIVFGVVFTLSYNKLKKKR